MHYRGRARRIALCCALWVFAIADGLTATTVFAADDTRNWDLTLGVAGAYEPNYSGATIKSWRLVVWADGAYRTDGFGTVALDSGSLTIAPELRWDVLDSPDVGLGPLLGYRSGRSDHNPGFPSADHGSTLPPGLPTVKGAIDAGAAGHVTVFGLPLFAQVRAALNRPQGVLVNLGAYVPFKPIPDIEVTVLPTVTLANARQMNAFYGVSATTAMASGLASYNPGAGWENAAIEIGADWRVSGGWHLIASAAYQRLLGNAARSPIIQTPNQPSAFLGAALQF